MEQQASNGIASQILIQRYGKEDHPSLTSFKLFTPIKGCNKYSFIPLSLPVQEEKKRFSLLASTALCSASEVSLNIILRSLRRNIWGLSGV